MIDALIDLLVNFGWPDAKARLAAEAFVAEHVEPLRKRATRLAAATVHCRVCRDCGDGPCCSSCDVEAACAALEEP